MTPRRDEHHLLDDVLSEAMSPDFREKLLASTLTSVRRRRRTRVAARAVMALAVAGIVGWFGWRASVFTPAEREHRQPSCRVIATEPLPASAIVRTRALDADQVVVSLSFPAMVRTLPGITRLIDDTELLALAGPYSAVLVRVGPQEQQLVISGARVDGGAPQ